VNFDFKQQDVSLMFEANAGLLERLRSSQVSTDPHLNVSSLLSQDDVVVFQSPTASTLVEVRNLNGPVWTAVMTTRYFGEYAEQGSFEKRGTYTREKMKRLIDLLTAAGGKLLFCGLVTLARCPVETAEQEPLRERLSAKIPGLKALAQDSTPFDFIIRASRRPDDIRFSNIQLGWYEERSVNVPVTAMQSGSFALPDWEMTVTGVGLELRYDQNNKQALRAGRRTWSPADFQKLVDGYLTDLPGAVTTIVNYLGAANA
jgi:hypothetical protein